MSLIRKNVPLAPLTYYKIGGPARYFAQPERPADLAEIADFIKANSLPYFVLGAGSNVLIDDEGFDGMVIHTAKLDQTLAQNEDTIEVGASVMVIQLLRHCMASGCDGLEFLVGVPGNLGGVFAMNAGTKLGEIAQTVQEITAYDLESKTKRAISRADIKYSYRAQHFLKPHEIIISGKLRVRASKPKTVQDHVQKLLNARKKSQPIDKPSCGSVFKNPDASERFQAWRLISDAGLRGYRIGNAQISELHTNFIINLGGAKASDVRALIQEAKKRVQEQFGVALDEEVRIVPRNGGKRI